MGTSRENLHVFLRSFRALLANYLSERRGFKKYSTSDKRNTQGDP
jgi:hypothetical protein